MGDDTDFEALRARDGSGEAFTRLHARVAPALAAWASLRTRGAIRARVDPDDLLQEIWWKALESFPRFDSERGSFRAWIFGVATNCYRQMARRSPQGAAAAREGDARIQELTPELQASWTSITADVRRRESVAELVEVVSALDEGERRLFVHRGLEGMPLKDVGEIMDLKSEVVRKRWMRLRQRLEEHPRLRDFVDAS